MLTMTINAGGVAEFSGDLDGAAFMDPAESTYIGFSDGTTAQVYKGEYGWRIRTLNSSAASNVHFRSQADRLGDEDVNDVHSDRLRIDMGNARLNYAVVGPQLIGRFTGQ